MEKTKIQLIKEKCEVIMEKFNSNTVCFTGHRVQKLPWRANENDPRCKKMIEETQGKIIEAIKQGKTNFISGMAIGFDMICAELVLELKEQYPYITLECALPCQDQDAKWNSHVRARYKKILEKADKVRCLYDTYNKECMQERNEYMVNNSSLIIALYDGKPGGTKKTIEHAKSLGKEVVEIQPNTDITPERDEQEEFIEYLKTHFQF